MGGIFVLFCFERSAITELTCNNKNNFNFITIFIVVEISNFIRRALFVVWGIAINLL